MPCGPVTPTARPPLVPAVRAARRTREPVRVADIVAKGHDRGRSLAGQQLLERLALATRRSRPQVDDEPPAIVAELVGRQLAVDLLDRGLDGGARRGPVVGLADMERHRRSLSLDEQPCRPAEHRRHPRGEDLGGFE